MRNTIFKVKATENLRVSGLALNVTLTKLWQISSSMIVLQIKQCTTETNVTIKLGEGKEVKEKF